MTDTSQPQSPFASLVPQRSVGLKLLLVCGLALLMAIPALFIHSVVQDRRMGADRALADVSEMVGGPQSVLGPVSCPYLPDRRDHDRAG
ncbi:MAG: inner membrane CreD family protein [Hyphomonas sp.]|jgi:inner membrane protein|uniref:inner membrane CreD family protein n=1 Tax=Hyphomonas sp. TaxID=87 RepID=UPI0032641327